MEPIFTDKQLNNMSREDLISLMKIVQEQTKKKDTEIQLLKEKQKELEFLNAMLSDRLTLAQRKQFGASSEKYVEGYEQMNLFNEAEASADAETEELFEEIRPSSYKRKKRKGKKEEDLSNFETVETRTYKLEGEARYCPECGKKYNVVTKETVKRLRFVPAKFEVEEEITYVYSCPKCGSMKRPEKEPSLIRGSIATPSLVAGIMNAKYVNGMPLARQEREKEQLKETVAYQAMSRIGILYKIEEMIHDKTPEEKYEERQKQSRPVMDALFEWLRMMEDSVDRSSLIGDAILYTLNQEVYLRRYLENGHLSIDNNSAERALKNFAVGRRNWLFAKSVRGADASALVYSITETALLNHLKPYAYLTYILDELRKMGAFPKEEELKKLLPWSEDFPEYCRTKLKK